MEGLLNALHGRKGSLDAWLEHCSEDEVRAAILELVSPTETLRDKFAAKAMQSLIATDNYGSAARVCAKDAYEFADAMLEVRKAS